MGTYETNKIFVSKRRAQLVSEAKCSELGNQNINKFLYKIIFRKQLGSGPCSQSCLYFQDFQGFKCISLIFQHSSLTYCIQLLKDQSSFFEIGSLANYRSIKTFNWVYRKRLNILKTFLEYISGILYCCLLKMFQRKKLL